MGTRNEVAREAQRVPYDIYKEPDLGPGGDAIAPATQTRPTRWTWRMPRCSSPQKRRGHRAVKVEILG